MAHRDLDHRSARDDAAPADGLGDFVGAARAEADAAVALGVCSLLLRDWRRGAIVATALVAAYAFFGHLAPTKSVVKKPGEGNRYTITGKGPVVEVTLNGGKVLSMDLRLWTSAKKNPDGSEIPPWLSKPKAELATKGFIGLQGKHGAKTNSENSR